MSELQRSAMSARLARIPLDLPPLSASENFSDEEEDDLGHLPPPKHAGPRSQSSGNRTSSASTHTPNPQFSPLSAASYFAQAIQVSVPASNLDIRTYYTPPALTPSTTDTRPARSSSTVIVCHHGAGFSALGFACFAENVRTITQGECGVLAYDARNHGKTASLSNPNQDPEPLDLSLSTLSADLTNLLTTLFPDPTTSPSFILLGHSMGGAVVVDACSALIAKKYSVTGVCVLDVVEGTALEALPHMHTLLNSRPEGFQSIEEAIEWHVAGNTIRNPTSARISVPSLFIPGDPDSAVKWKWRISLRSTAPFWSEWFTTLSSKFLGVRAARLLVLAGADRLDKPLMIGQMQGKFQLIVVPDVGHSLHEDNPSHLAEVLVEFWKRNERVIPGVKKVGDD